jgi:hypothetical protein
MREVFKVDLDLKIPKSWMKIWIKTRKSILRSLGIKPTEVILSNSNRGYHVWFHAETEEKLTPTECNFVQYLLGDDSVSGDCHMFYKENGELKYGSVEEVYNSFIKGNNIEVLTIKGNWRRNWKNNKNYGLNPSVKYGKITFAKVINAMFRGIKDVYRITTYGGKWVEITDGHSLMVSSAPTNSFVPKTFMEINGERIVVVDSLKFEGNEFQKGAISLRSIRKIEYIGKKPVYDFQVNPTETFIVNNILCHNTGRVIINQRRIARRMDWNYFNRMFDRVIWRRKHKCNCSRHQRFLRKQEEGIIEFYKLIELEGGGENTLPHLNKNKRK